MCSASYTTYSGKTRWYHLRQSRPSLAFFGLEQCKPGRGVKLNKGCFFFFIQVKTIFSPIVLLAPRFTIICTNVERDGNFFFETFIDSGAKKNRRGRRLGAEQTGVTNAMGDNVAFSWQRRPFRILFVFVVFYSKSIFWIKKLFFIIFIYTFYMVIQYKRLNLPSKCLNFLLP